jgi:flagellar L-ring protein precursor FlgH
MFKKTLIGTTALLIFLSFTMAARGDSLWKKRVGVGNHVYRDKVATREGDILTILIKEQQQIENDEETEYKKKGSLDAALTDFNIDPGVFGDLLPSVKGESTRNFKGEATLDKEGSFETRLTVKVIDVEPNGNLIIEGHREIRIDEEVKKIKITGIVRPSDISVYNTVYSENVANAKVSYEGNGPMTRATERGWFSKILDFLWPF